MPPKKGAKKGGKKNQDDDEFWEKKEAALAESTPASEEIPQPAKSGKNKKTGGVFDLLDEGENMDDEDEGGDLMAMIAANAAKKKDKKKNKKKYDFDEDEDQQDQDQPPAEVDTKPNLDDEWPEDDVKPKKGKKDKKNKKKAAPVDEDEEMEEPPAAEPTTAVNIDDEWPEEDVKPKKGKKGKKGKKAVEEEEEDLDAILEKAAAERRAAEEAAKAAEPTPTPAPAVEAEPAAEDDDEAGDDGPKILTKAQKEKLKKEKEKAKKKAQAAAKKATAPTPATEEPTPSTPEPAAEAEEDEGDEEAAGGDKKKKKKKKPAAKAAEPAPAAAKGKKVPAHIAAMQAAMEEKKRMEEEARKVEEERLRKIEEEEARLAEEEAKIAGAKAAKKAKEKEKQARAKAEGRALTPAQKREKAAAEARKQAMLASGMVVAGLQDGGAAPEAKKKVVYGNRKKQQKPTAKETATPPPEPASPAPAPVEKKPEPTPAPAKEESEDDWDKSEDEVEKVVAGVDKLKVEESEDDWDKSSDDEAAPAPASAAAPKAAAPTPSKTTPASAPTPAAPATNDKPAPKANGKAPAPAEEEEESSEEESSEEETDSDDDSEEESDSEDEAAVRKAAALEKIEKRKQAAQAAGNKEDLRSPICCILGHVDHGKTKLLDQIRQTSVAEGEAGGITQQIGATFFPKSAIVEKTAVVNPENATDVKIPGLLIIDTPGHESFSNLRTRGSSLCNIAILVVDITQGLEPQTIESINLLKKGRTPFIVALNKIDRMYGWEPKKNAGFRETLNSQKAFVKSEFEDRVKAAKLAFAEQGFNAELFDENKNLGRNISLVPTSAITGEGIPDMLLLLVKLTQERMNANLMYISELECTILEVKIIEGLGTTIDVILSNGVMREGDKIVLCGSDGPIVTNVRALLTPQPLRELRIKSAYVHNKEVRAALGVKISAPGLEKAIAGAKLYVAHDDDEVEAYKDMAMDDLSSLAKFVTKTGKGVWVQASTLGSLEALLTFLQQMKIPVFNFGIGPVYKSTIVKAGIMLDRAPEYAVIMAFDVTIEKEAEELAKKAGMKIFSSMVIYHLFDAFQKYMAEVQESRRKEAAPNAVWPVRMKILKAFAHRDPIILGCDIIEGSMRVGTPVGVVKVDKATGKREIITLGKITSLEINHKPFTIVKKSQVGAGVAVKIERAPYQTARMFNRHFDEKDEVVSLITRQSIDTLKTTFRDQVEMADWAIIKKMKTEQGVA